MPGRSAGVRGWSGRCFSLHAARSANQCLVNPGQRAALTMPWLTTQTFKDELASAGRSLAHKVHAVAHQNCIVSDSIALFAIDYAQDECSRRINEYFMGRSVMSSFSDPKD